MSANARTSVVAHGPANDPRLPPRDLPQDLKQLIADATHPFGSALAMHAGDAPTFGTSRCLGYINLPLRFGDFKTYLFHTTSFGGDVLVLTKGDISSADPLFVRFHSECITSETLGACDCDCVEQLNGAFKKIADEGRGALFYLRQEGRGVGYSGKARDRMLVTCSDEELSTYDAFHALGFRNDHRDFSVLGEIRYLLGMRAPVRVLTNNPEKVSAARAAGFDIHDTVQVEFPANPFNAAYLKAKQRQANHNLTNHNLNAPSTDRALAPEQANIFKPYLLPGMQRFCHNATYNLPVRPLGTEVLLPSEKARELMSIASRLDPALIRSFEVIHPMSENRFTSISLDYDKLTKLRTNAVENPLDRWLMTNPYWFQDHVYHDSVTHLDHVVLTYQRPNTENVIPIIRVQSENLLGRFPVVQQAPSNYHRALSAIIRRGRGLIALYPQDGRGHGLSAVVQERFLIDQGRANSRDEACSMLGITPENRNYDPLALLISHHYPNQTVDLVNGTTPQGERPENLIASLGRVGITVQNIL